MFHLQQKDFHKMRTERKIQTFNAKSALPISQNLVNRCGRNLKKDQLGGVIFGCTRHTMKECLSKQLFGLPAQHFSYVENINPKMPLFLFNYSDRKLHGIFEATSHGKMFIDPYAWINDDYTDETQYPAQAIQDVKDDYTMSRFTNVEKTNIQLFLSKNATKSFQPLNFIGLYTTQVRLKGIPWMILMNAQVFHIWISLIHVLRQE
ncbi:hypothetical protein KIW84_076787 [Lathyrus oleraceus]|uniref:DCD domain-containing protein n=1 Tax=Pisum sativum TaxID=3888 RepID=A0A9D4VXS9_PEA|nr:hypothetical protein KIW84_076787 [Pisum sativum]